MKDDNTLWMSGNSLGKIKLAAVGLRGSLATKMRGQFLSEYGGFQFYLHKIAET